MNVREISRLRLTSRSTGLVALGVLVLLGLGAWQFFSGPPSPWRLKRQIMSYLKKQSGRSDFASAFPLPSKEEMARASIDDSREKSAAKPARDFDSLAREYLDLTREVLVLQREIETGQAALVARPGGSTEPTAAPSTNAPAAASPSRPTAAARAALEKDLPGKRQTLTAKQAQVAPIAEELWAIQRLWAAQRTAAEAVDATGLSKAWGEKAREFRQKLSEAPSYAAMYEIIGQELWIADQLLRSRGLQHRRLAVVIARNAAYDALRFAENGGLGARICQAYLWPNLDVADRSDRRSNLSVDNLLNECADIFRRADEDHNVVQNYQLAVKLNDNPLRADWARSQIAMHYQQVGDYAKAVAYLKQIKATNDFSWALRRLSWLEQRAKRQQ